MAETTIGLGGDRDTDVHAPDGAAGWTAATDNTKLSNARAAAQRANITGINWFAWFTVNDRAGGPVRQQYRVTFDAPTDGRSHNFYVFDGTSVRQVTPTAAPGKGNKARLQLMFSTGDPGVGMT